MRATRVILGLTFVGLFAACEPEPAGLEDGTLGAPSFIAPVLMSQNGATVVKGDWGCGLIDGEGNWFPPGWPDEGLFCKTEVATNSKNMNAMVVVKASGVPNPTGKTVHWGPYNPGQGWADSYPELDGPPYPCFVLGPDRDFDNPFFTINWKATVSASGEAMLICHYAKKWEFQWPD